MTDPISDMIIRMKNAAMAGKDVVVMPMSKLKLSIAERMKTRGFLADVATRGKGPGKTIEVTLGRTMAGAFRFTDVKRISKPGMRVYAGANDMKRVRGGTGAVLVSTPKGILFGDEAMKEKVGGEVLFEIW